MNEDQPIAGSGGGVRAKTRLSWTKIFEKHSNSRQHPALYENAVEFHQPLFKPALVAYRGTSYQMSQSPRPAALSTSFIGAA